MSFISNPIRRRGALLLALAVVACASSSCAKPARPNVLLITLDTTRADFLGAYGRTGDPTPNLDRIASEGTRFDLAISAAAVTPVSHASILTGLYTMEHGLRVMAASGGFRLAPGVPTLASVLAEEGYRTAAIHSAFPVSKHFGLERGFEVFQSFDAGAAHGPDGHDWTAGNWQRRSDETTNKALEYVEHERDPFFLWVHYWDPHDAVLLPPPEFLPQQMPRNERGEIVASKRLYATEIRYMDREIGRLLKKLEEQGRYENTIVFVIADHGEGLGDHGWPYHGLLYQEQIRVPLLVRVPGAAQVKSVDKLVRSIDVFPTVLDYLGIASKTPVRGQSLRALIEGRDEPDRIAYSDQINAYDRNIDIVKTRPLDDFLYCAMSSTWKLIYRPTHPEQSELFDLVQDPSELRNVYARNTEQARALEAELARFNGWVTTPFAPIGSAGDLAAASKALAGLGYTGSDHATVATKWRWTCPSHRDQASVERRTCPVCGAAPILIGSEP